MPLILFLVLWKPGSQMDWGRRQPIEVMEELYLICEDSLEGIFTGIYDAYLKKKPHGQVHLIVGEEVNYRLFAVYETCAPDERKAAKVAGTIMRSLGRKHILPSAGPLPPGNLIRGKRFTRLWWQGFP